MIKKNNLFALLIGDTKMRLCDQTHMHIKNIFMIRNAISLIACCYIYEPISIRV